MSRSNSSEQLGAWIPLCLTTGFVCVAAMLAHFLWIENLVGGFVPLSIRAVPGFCGAIAIYSGYRALPIESEVTGAWVQASAFTGILGVAVSTVSLLYGFVMAVGTMT